MFGETPDYSDCSDSDGEGGYNFPLERENALDHLETHQREVRSPHQRERERKGERVGEKEREREREAAPPPSTVRAAHPPRCAARTREGVRAKLPLLRSPFD